MQEAALRQLPDIVVATPGRMIDHLRNSMSVHLDELAVLILDEADRLLELGFSAEISELVHFPCLSLLITVVLFFFGPREYQTRAGDGLVFWYYSCH